ncbi:hypothetical protein GLOIN_2v1605697 [Rhizophagus clarus]|uniref:Uncharacterized protein n=1 Tax=Rhizophagus clarus TaxID=94130 RepID=A0A8H3L5F1_9GLOM|nr:hypothetical protein GLOIN_2v1605697 [Rhizophagus clarus]
MPKGTRGYKKLFAGKCERFGYGHKKLIGSEFEKATVISVSSSTESSSSDTLSSENEDNAMNMHKKDPFFVASTKTSAMNFLKKQQQTKKLLRSPSTPQTPTQICVSKSDKHQSTHLLKHKRTVKVASKNPLKGKDKATTCSTQKLNIGLPPRLLMNFLKVLSWLTLNLHLRKVMTWNVIMIWKKSFTKLGKSIIKFAIN